jgi:putative ABC transport system substrate-binding protein
MNRREFLAVLLLGSTMESAQAQQSGRSKVYRIAYVDPQTAVAEQRESLAGSGFFEELHRLGYVEGRSLVVEQYSSETRAFRNPELARAAVERNPNAIVALTNPMVLDFKSATSTIPIVGITADPVALGIVSNLARPGGNITGVSVDAGIGMWSKRLELLRAAAPKTSKAAFLGSKAAWDGLTEPRCAKRHGEWAFCLLGHLSLPPSRRRTIAACWPLRFRRAQKRSSSAICPITSLTTA